MFIGNSLEVLSKIECRLFEKVKSLDGITDAKELDKPIAKMIDCDERDQEDNYDVLDNISLNPRTVYEIDGQLYETDDNGNIFKTNGELNKDTEYTINGITYKTDSLGRPSIWRGEPGYNPEAERDGEAQTDAGGTDRLEGDDGGHLVARILDGSPGNENIVPMRDTVNRGDYKKAENEIAKAKQEGRNVLDSGIIYYEGNSFRPSCIERDYTIDGERRILKVDNVEGSKDLLNDIKSFISEEDYGMLEERIKDMEEDGNKVSVTSVYQKFDVDGDLESITVGVRDETSKTKSYITYDINGG